MKFKKILKTSLALLTVLTVGILVGYFLHRPKPVQVDNPDDPNLPYISFVLEVYDIIKENHWQELKETDLNNLFLLASQKLTGLSDTQELKTKDDLKQYLGTVFKQYQQDSQKQEFSATLADMVLSNLTPFGRSRLYTKKEQDNLSNTVANINPDVDQYQVLGVKKDASVDEIDKAYQNKIKNLDPKKDADIISKLETAKNTLTDDLSKSLYDQHGIEPSVTIKVIKPNTAYLKISKFTHTTFEEMVNLLDKTYKANKLTNLIIDLRDNIGGNIDSLPYFLGPFIGSDQYAYQFFHQGDKTDFKTKTGWLESLVPYKKVVVLINENSQSTAELMASVLKKYNVGILVGTPTKGWGTVEKVFPITTNINDSTTYSVFLVHSLTLREDGQPIEENKVIPTVDITSKNWQQELFSYYSDQSLVDQVAQILNSNI